MLQSNTKRYREKKKIVIISFFSIIYFRNIKCKDVYHWKREYNDVSAFKILNGDKVLSLTQSLSLIARNYADSSAGTPDNGFL